VLHCLTLWCGCLTLWGIPGDDFQQFDHLIELVRRCRSSSDAEVLPERSQRYICAGEVFSTGSLIKQLHEICREPEAQGGCFVLFHGVPRLCFSALLRHTLRNAM
jgi:hypothetical protein